MSCNNCNCECDTITIPQGPKGNDGTDGSNGVSIIYTDLGDHSNGSTGVMSKVHSFSISSNEITNDGSIFKLELGFYKTGGGGTSELLIEIDDTNATKVVSPTHSVTSANLLVRKGFFWLNAEKVDNNGSDALSESILTYNDKSLYGANTNIVGGNDYTASNALGVDLTNAITFNINTKELKTANSLVIDHIRLLKYIKV